MAGAFEFVNLAGSVYSKGDVAFSNDGFSLLAPVGNRISVYNLKDHISKTLPVESMTNFTCMGLSPNGLLLVAGNEVGEVRFISLVSNSDLHVLRPGGHIRHCKFSPDGQLVAIAKENVVLVYKVPHEGSAASGESFGLKRSFANTKDITSICWSFDSRLMAVTSANGEIGVYSTEHFVNFKAQTLTVGTEGVIKCFFVKGSYEFYTLQASGILRNWVCLKKPEEFIVSDIADQRAREKLRRGNETDAGEIVKEEMVRFKCPNKHYYNELFEKGEKRPPITSAYYCERNGLLITGFEGMFFIHELPSFTQLHSLKLSDSNIATITANSTAEWIAFGCPSLGQLIVYEWQSETIIMKQQGHHDITECCAYSPTGHLIATGGVDTKVKLWGVNDLFCFRTFDEHTAPVTDIIFTKSDNSLLSASLDGTVRAYELLRYRNFRTFTSPRLVQFGCISVDSSGELVVAGGRDTFDLFLWSMRTGHLLETLSGHEGPISAVAFSPSPASSMLVSVGLDNCMKVWESIESNASHETIRLNSEGTCLSMAPDGKTVAVGTADGNLSFFSIGAEMNMEKGSINGRLHLHTGRTSADKTTAKKSMLGKQFRTLAYSPDGKFILAAGPSKIICLYSVEYQHLVHRFTVTKNHSFDGIEEFVNRRRLTDFGNMDLYESRENGDKLALPGVRKGDMAARTFKNEIRVTCARFSPNGRSWMATTTEGILLYSSDSVKMFDPINADLTVTPEGISNLILKEEKYDEALMMALRLNMSEHTRFAVESVPIDGMEMICRGLPLHYTKKLLEFLAKELVVTRRVEFYSTFINFLIRFNVWTFRSQAETMKPLLNDLRKASRMKADELREIFDYAKYMSKYLALAYDARNPDVKMAGSSALINRLVGRKRLLDEVKVETIGEEEIKVEQQEEEMDTQHEY